MSDGSLSEWVVLREDEGNVSLFIPLFRKEEKTQSQGTRPPLDDVFDRAKVSDDAHNRTLSYTISGKYITIDDASILDTVNLYQSKVLHDLDAPLFSGAVYRNLTFVLRAGPDKDSVSVDFVMRYGTVDVDNVTYPASMSPDELAASKEAAMRCIDIAVAGVVRTSTLVTVTPKN